MSESRFKGIENDVGRLQAEVVELRKRIAGTWELTAESKVSTWDWDQNGFENTTDSTLAWTDSSPDRTLSIQPTGTDFKFWVAGQRYISTGDTVQITDVEGVHVIYYDGATLTALANPTEAQISSIIRTKATVSIVYWDTSASTAIYVGEERHGKLMSPSTHAYLHFTEGLRYLSGLGLNTLSVDQSGNDNAHAQFGVDAGEVTDEDLYLAIAAVASGTGLPIYYMLGAGAEWQKYAKSGFSVRTYDGTSSTRLAWNEYTGGAWQLTEVANTDFVLCHVFATTEKDSPMVAIMGQNDYATKSAAQSGALVEIYSLILDDILPPEIKPVATVIFQTRNIYSNDVQARVVSTDDGDDYVDWRSETISRVAVSTTDHNALTNVTSDQHHNQVHELAGADHTATGLTVGHVIRATGATTFAWAELQHDDLGGVAADQHHTGFIGLDGDSGSATPDGSDAVTIAGGTAISTSAATSTVTVTHASGDYGDLHTNYTEHDQNETVSGAWTFENNLTTRHIFPQATDTYDLGSSTVLWRKGWLSELDAVLFAENTITLLGGWFYVTKYAGTVQEDVDGSETAIDLGVSDSVLSANDFIVFRQSLKVEYMQLTSYAGANVWNVTRNVDGSGANTWPQGAPFAVFGYTGDGRIELNAYDTPRMSILSQGSTYNSQTEYVRLGDLNGLADYTSQEFGIFIGDYAGDSWMAYDPTNGLRLDGSAIIDGTVQATAFTNDLGAMFFSQADGLLLLGPGCEITTTSWTSQRRQPSLISGAFHREGGRWTGTRGLVIEEGTVNLVVNPSLETNATGYSGAGTPTSAARASDESRFGDYSYKVVTGVNAFAGGQNGTNISISTLTDYAVSLWIKCSVSGVPMRIRVNLDNSGVQTINFTSALGWNRISGIVTSDGSDTAIDYIRLAKVNDATDLTFWIDGLQVEESSYVTTYCDGSLGTGYSWSGTAHASTSTRTATQVNLDDQAGLLDGNDAFSVSLWWQAPYDYDGTWPVASGSNFLFDVYEDATNYVRIVFNSSDNTIRAEYRESSTVSSTYELTFSAGDWVHIVVNVDTSGDLELAVNGVIRDTDDMSARSSISPDQMNLGSDRAGATRAGGVYSELAIFDRVLTAGEIAALYSRGSAMVDAGLLDAPGVYLFDGRFSLQSSTVGKHTEIVAAGMGVYEDTGPTGVGRILGGFVNATSKELDLASDDLGWFGYNSSDVLQVAWWASGSNAGKIIAGAGNIVLDSSGLTIDAGTQYQNAVNWDASGSKVGYIYTDITGTVRVRADAPSASEVGTIVLRATNSDGGVSGESEIIINSAKTAVDGYIEITSDGDVTVYLGDALGNDSFEIRDSGLSLRSRLDSDGHLRVAGGLFVGSVGSAPSAGAIHFLERSSDPAEPGEGEAVIWMSDGTEKGSDGDVMIASKAGGTTRYTTLFDHSAGAVW